MVQKISFIEAGYTRQFEKLVYPTNGKWRMIRFPSSVAVIEHQTQGVILLDTGYTPRFNEITKRFPEKLYSLATPVTVRPEDTAIHQLKARGINVNDVRTVVLSHFHADHVGGALDFTHAKFAYSQAEYEHFEGCSRLGQLSHAYLPALLPTDLRQRKAKPGKKIPLPRLGPWWMGEDLFGDESIFLVPLPGHSIGHMGIYLPNVGGQEFILVGDSVWVQGSIKDNVMPMKMAQFFFSNANDYRDNIQRLHNLPTEINVVPCHCHETLKKLGMHAV